MKSITSRSLLRTFGWCVVLFLISAQGWGQSTGCIQGDCVNGQGTYTFANDDQYVGEWRDDKYHGQGTYTFASGAQYVGEFRDSKRHGQGTLTYANGNVRCARWENNRYFPSRSCSSPSVPVASSTTSARETDTIVVGCSPGGSCFDGQGTYTFADGSQYVGEYRNSKKKC